MCNEVESVEFWGIEFRVASYVPKGELWLVNPPALARMAAVVGLADYLSSSYTNAEPPFIVTHPGSRDQIVRKLMEFFEVEPDAKIINIES